jgi:hypothetical protein
MKLRMNKWQIGIGAATLLVASLGMAWAKPAPSEIGREKIKIDLSIPPNGIQVTDLGAVGADRRVRIEVTVRAWAAGAGACSGPFKVKLESTEDPRTGWSLVGTAGVANMCVRLSRVKLPSVKRSFTTTFPSGSAHKLLATVDFLDQVDEAREDNNIYGRGYIVP